MKKKLVINTRPLHQAQALSVLLREANIEVLELPMLEMMSCFDKNSFIKASASLRADDWLVFTSANGVQIFSDSFAATDPVIERLSRECKIAAVGKQTALACERLGWPVEFVSSKANAEMLGQELANRLAEREPKPKVVLMRARAANSALPVQLKAARLEVLEIPVYYSQAPRVTSETRITLRSFYQADEIELVVLSSGFAAENWVRLLDEESLPIAQVPVAVIGPETETRAVALGLRVALVAKDPSMRTLAAEIVKSRAENS